MVTQPQAPPALNGAALGQKHHLDLPAHTGANGANGTTLLPKIAPTNGHNGHQENVSPLRTVKPNEPLPLRGGTMPDTIEHLEEYPPALQTQFRWILSRLDNHDAEFKGVETRFEGTERRTVELAGIDAQSREDRSQIRYRLDLLEGTLRKLQETQEKDALPLIKEIHDTTRLAQEQASDLREHSVAIAELLKAVQTLTVSQADQQKDQKRLRKTIRRIEDTQRHQMSRLLKWSGGILGIAVSLTVIFTYFAQHLAFH